MVESISSAVPRRRNTARPSTRAPSRRCALREGRLNRVMRLHDQRTVERACHRAFGFSPKLLLRRQRFMRSLSDFMLDPTLKWIGAIDSHYHDQAQFVRDFRQFIGMSPRQYAALPKPLIGAVMRERARFAGSAVQTLDGPAGVSVSP